MWGEIIFSIEKEGYIFILVLFILFISFNICFAEATIETSKNATSEVETALDKAADAIMETSEAGFSVARMNDTLILAKQLFEAQIALKSMGGTPNFDIVLKNVETILDLKDKTFDTADQLKALKLYLDEVNSSANINLTKAYELYYSAESDFNTNAYS